nr:hypothetical protein [Tanacetum cinerariifolium]
MSSDQFFYTSSDDENEVNSELAMFTNASQAPYEASKPKVQRTPVARDRYGAHDHITDMEKLYAYHDEKHGFPGIMNNDVNVLRQSTIFNDLKSGSAPEVPFVANNVLYKRGYYFTDGIYPQ